MVRYIANSKAGIMRLELHLTDFSFLPRSRSKNNRDDNEFQGKRKKVRGTSPSVERNKSRNKYSSRNHSGRRRNDESTKNSTNNSVHTPSNDKQFLKSTKENDSKVGILFTLILI